LVLGVVLLIAFAAIQAWKPDTATIAPRILKQRTMIAGSITAGLTGSHMMVFGR